MPGTYSRCRPDPLRCLPQFLVSVPSRCARLSRFISHFLLKDQRSGLRLSWWLYLPVNVVALLRVQPHFAKRTCQPGGLSRHLVSFLLLASIRLPPSKMFISPSFPLVSVCTCASLFCVRIFCLSSLRLASSCASLRSGSFVNPLLQQESQCLF